MAIIEVGKDVDAYCSKCKLVLAHVVVTMRGAKPLKVKCHTCDGEHNYKAEKPVPRTAAKKDDVKKPAKKSSSRKTKSWGETMTEAQTKPHKQYEISGNFAVDEWIEHSKFGLGQVQAFTPPNKITVRFADVPDAETGKDKEVKKLLICNQNRG